MSLTTVNYLDSGASGGDEGISASSITSILDETDPPDRTGRLGIPAAVDLESGQLALRVDSHAHAAAPDRGSRSGATLHGTRDDGVPRTLRVVLASCCDIPKMVITYPYVTFAMTTLFLGGLAFSSFANLGILARQRSIVVPFLLLVVCVPPMTRRGERNPRQSTRPCRTGECVRTARCRRATVPSWRAAAHRGR